jgi:hypothetical protein
VLNWHRFTAYGPLGAELGLFALGSRHNMGQGGGKLRTTEVNALVESTICT